jgi:hypothetical protein
MDEFGIPLTNVACVLCPVNNEHGERREIEAFPEFRTDQHGWCFLQGIEVRSMPVAEKSNSQCATLMLTVMR